MESHDAQIPKTYPFKMNTRISSMVMTGLNVLTVRLLKKNPKIQLKYFVRCCRPLTCNFFGEFPETLIRANPFHCTSPLPDSLVADMLSFVKLAEHFER